MLTSHNPTLPIASWNKDLSLRYSWISDTWNNILGQPASGANPESPALMDMIGHSDAEVLPVWLQEQLLQQDFLTLASQEAQTHDQPWPGAEGSERILRITRQPIFNSEQKLCGLSGVARDVTVEHQLKQQLQQQSNQQANWLNALQGHTLIANMDRHGSFTYVSPPLCRLIGCSSDSIQGKSRDTTPLSLRNTNIGHYLTLAEQGTPVSIECSGRNGNGERYWLRSLIIALHPPSSMEQSFLELFTDLTSEKMAAVEMENVNTKLVRIHNENAELISKLEVAAHTDPLTGLANRRALFERAQQEQARAKRQRTDLSLIVMDIDHFKTINDTYGHEAGDIALQCLAKWGLEVLRSIDLLARTGGEEFVILLPDTNIEQAQGAAERLRQALAAGIVPTQPKSIQFTVSLGIARTIEGEDIDDAIVRADKALYRAKAEGRNCLRIEE